MCLCMCVCVSVFVCEYKCVCVCLCVCMCMREWLCMCEYLCEYLCMCARMCMCVCLCMNECVCVRVCFINLLYLLYFFSPSSCKLSKWWSWTLVRRQRDCTNSHHILCWHLCSLQSVKVRHYTKVEENIQSTVYIQAPQHILGFKVLSRTKCRNSHNIHCQHPCNYYLQSEEVGHYACRKEKIQTPITFFSSLPPPPFLFCWCPLIVPLHLYAMAQYSYYLNETWNGYCVCV